MLMDEDNCNVCNYSRLPVYHKEIDNIVGVLHIRDLFTIFKQVDANRHLYEYKNIIRKELFCTCAQEYRWYFQRNARRQMHLAWKVIDEYTSTSDGVLSLEDIIGRGYGNINI